MLRCCLLLHTVGWMYCKSSSDRAVLGCFTAQRNQQLQQQQHQQQHGTGCEYTWLVETRLPRSRGRMLGFLLWGVPLMMARIISPVLCLDTPHQAHRTPLHILNRFCDPGLVSTLAMRPGSRGYVGGGLQPPGTGMRMATGEKHSQNHTRVYRTC